MAVLSRVRKSSGQATSTPLSREAIIKVAKAKEKTRRSAREMLARDTIEWSPDFQRILALPRRQKPDLQKISAELTAKLKRPDGKQELWAYQAWPLWEFPQVGGGLAVLEVSAGKTLLGLLMPMVMPNCKRAILLLPASLKAQLFDRDLENYGRHWRLPNIAGTDRFVNDGRPSLKVIAYSELQGIDASELLAQEHADLAMGDEVQALRNRTSARTNRFLKFFQRLPDMRFCGWTASITSDTPEDYAHFLALALGPGSPLPIDPGDVEAWARVLKPGDVSTDPGVLRKFCMPGESTASGFRRRLTDTPGVIITEGTAIKAKLLLRKWNPPAMPEKIEDFLRVLRRAPKDGGWRRPDGEELEEAVQVRECARQLACGFYYRWRFPRQEPVELKDEWFVRRQAFNRELRTKLMQMLPFLDSRGLCERAAKRFYEGGCAKCDRGRMEPHKPKCPAAYKEPLWDSMNWLGWSAIEDSVYHEQEAVWESDWMLNAVGDWAMERPGIVWVERSAFGHELSKRTRLPYYGGGPAASKEIIKENGTRSIIVAMDAHKLGKNLQKEFNRNFIVTVPASNDNIEQSIGRTHRNGQPADLVTVDIPLHTRELQDALDKAEERAAYVFHHHGTSQKLVYGTWE